MSAEDKKITLQQAIDWTTEWRSVESNYNAHNELNAFLIPVQDLQGVLAEMENPANNAYVRAYIGVDTSSGKSEEKLIIVGTEQDRSGVYRDLLPNPADEPSNGNSLWDFSKRCPPYCDDDSDLN